MGKKTLQYVRAENIIKENIKDGVFTNKLPGERILAKEIGVSYMTLRQAVKNLVDAGILYKIPAKGIFVNKAGANKSETHNIGFFLDDRIKDGIASSYYSLIFKVLEKNITKRDYNLVFFSNFDDLNPLHKRKKIDGIIISFFPRLEEKIREVKKLMPVVLIDNSSSDKSIPSVIIDNFNGVIDAIGYLCGLGHRRIGYISGLLDSHVGQDRLKGYLSSLNDHAIERDKGLIYNGDYSVHSGEKGTSYLLSQHSPPTAIMCANDAMAIGAIKAIREKGLTVPDDISVVGFDDIDLASQVHPPLTTVAAPIIQIAEQSVNLLFSLIAGVNLDNRQIALSTQLVVRNSSARPKVPA
jgi:DNA-binding LacI/PurR family transcriptional regulator